MKRQNHAYDVHVVTESTTFAIVAKSVGAAVAIARRATMHRALLRFQDAVRKEKRPEVIAAKRKEILGPVSRCFQAAEGGGWYGVSVECRDQITATLHAGIGEVSLATSRGNSKWARRMEAAGIQSQGNPKVRRERPQADGKLYRRVKSARPDGKSGLSVLLNNPGRRKLPGSRAKVAAAVLKARQNREWANGQFGNAIRNVQRAELRDKQIKARELKAVAA
jgi:hypothetical protein